MMPSFSYLALLASLILPSILLANSQILKGAMKLVDSEGSPEISTFSGASQLNAGLMKGLIIKNLLSVKTNAEEACTLQASNNTIFDLTANAHLHLERFDHFTNENGTIESTRLNIQLDVGALTLDASNASKGSQILIETKCGRVKTYNGLLVIEMVFNKSRNISKMTVEAIRGQVEFEAIDGKFYDISRGQLLNVYGNSNSLSVSLSKGWGENSEQFINYKNKLNSTLSEDFSTKEFESFFQVVSEESSEVESDSKAALVDQNTVKPIGIRPIASGQVVYPRRAVSE